MGRGNKNIDKIQKYRQISIFEPLSSISLLMVEGQVGNLGKKFVFFCYELGTVFLVYYGLRKIEHAKNGRYQALHYC